MSARVAEKLSDLPPLNIAGLLTTPSATGPFEFFRDKLKQLLAVPLQGEHAGFLIAVTTEMNGSTPFIALREHLRSLKQPVEVQVCSPRIIALLLAQWEETILASEDQGDRTTVERHFDELLAHAIGVNASDIHIERSYGHAQVRMRVNGILQVYADWPAEYADSMAQMLYSVAADADGKDTTYDAKVPQDGRIGKTLLVDGEQREVSVRFASMPVRGGSDVTLRVLPEGRSKDDAYIPLEKLGYEESQIELINSMVSQPVGAVVIAGVTGSGKSTTLKSLLMWLDKLHRGESKIRSIEDPPEYVIPGVRQSPVVRSQQREGSPFGLMIRAAMRSDPDTIMVGEVRDPDTVELLVSATLSGHKVLCTIHTVSANTVPARLFTINARSPINIRDIIASGDFLAGAIYQKLLPVLCPHCSHRVESWSDIADSGLQSRLKLKLDLGTDTIRLRGPGCGKCRSGIRGRTICAETILPDYELIRLYGEGDDFGALRHWRSKFRPTRGGEPFQALGAFALDHGIHKLRQGIVDPHDVELQLGALDRFDSLCAGGRP